MTEELEPITTATKLYHNRCHDCGQLLPRIRWVPKNHPTKEHALCRQCESNYDDPHCA